MRNSPAQLLISIIIPAHNEASNIRWHHDKINNYLKSQSLHHEILYINDGSTDETLKIMRDLSKEDSSTQYISFSRNFGKEAATAAGIQKCKGDVALIIDADGQHPIEILGEFLEKYHEGYNIVAGIRVHNAGESILNKFTSSGFYFVTRLASGKKTSGKETDFRLIDRRVIEAFRSMTERNRVTRDLIDWLGFAKIEVPFVAEERHAGTATYTLRKRLKLASNAIVSQSTRPLKLIAALGGTIAFLSVIVLIVVIADKYLLGDPLGLEVTGVAVLAIFISFLIGIVLICQGLLALYLESVYHETQNRPLYIIDEESL